MRVDALLTILGMAVAGYATRAGGLWLMRFVPSSPRVEAWLQHLPGTVLIALIAPCGRCLYGCGLGSLCGRAGDGSSGSAYQESATGDHSRRWNGAAAPPICSLKVLRRVEEAIILAHLFSLLCSARLNRCGV